MSTRPRYAEGTVVAVEKSRSEMQTLLSKHGVQEMAWGSKPSGDVLHFALGGYQHELRIVRPDVAAMRELHAKGYRTPGSTWELAAEAEWRRRWRANLMLLKMKLEFIDSGESTLERELLPMRLLRDGRTLEQAVEAGSLPMLAAEASS